jgi:hypothetical protein
MSLAAPQPAAQQSETSLKRRGLFAAVWAAVAAVILKETTQPVQAGVDGDVVLGAFNSTSGETSINCSDFFAFEALSTHAGGIGLRGGCTAGSNSWGVFGFGNRYGVAGSVVNSSGAFSDTAGVLGQNDEITPGACGVEGIASGPNSVGVLGKIATYSTTNGTAVYGVNSSLYTGSYAGGGGFGVLGLSQHGHGLVGGTNAPGAGGFVGSSNGVAGAWAGIFYGPVIVEGDFTVYGGAKSAAVPHPDGSHRRLYCVESPESWFEDFGKGQLTCGRADVTFDPDFAAMVNLDDYHVFVTGYGDYELTVTEQTSSGFQVQAKDAASMNRFSWRVVAKRKDIAGPRFEPVTLPAKLVLPDFPADSEPSTKPRVPGTSRP